MKLTRKVISGMLSVSLSVTLLTGISFNVNSNGIKAKAESVSQSSVTTVLETDVETASEGCTMLGVYGSYYSQAQDALNRINEIRKEACDDGNVPDPRNNSRMLSSDDYVPIKWSKDLESIARIRAMEGGLAFSFLSSGHSRLNGKDIWSVMYNDVRSYAENLAYNWGHSMVSGINQWYEEKSDWVNKTPGTVTGHYTSIINPKYTYIGLGDFYTDEAKYPNTLAGAFCSSSENLDDSMQLAQTNVIQKIEVKNSYISGYTLEGKNTIDIGNTTELDLRANLVNSSKTLKLWVLGPVTYTSSDISVVQVEDNGVITGQNAGTATITAKSGSNELASILITVKQTATPSPEVTQRPTASPTPTVSPTPIPTASPSPTVRPTQTPTASPSPTVRPTPIPTASPSPTVRPTQTPTASPSPTVRPTQTPTASPSPSAKATQSPTSAAPEETEKVTPSPIPSIRPTASPKPSPVTSIWSSVSDEPSPTSVPVTSKEPENVKNGTKVTDKNSKAVYKVTGTDKNKTVEYVKSTKQKPDNVTIPDTIKINGNVYKVTSIGKNAFKDNKKLKSVQIGKNIISIGTKAFSGCKKLSNITVKTNKLTAANIGKNAFSNGYPKPQVKADKSKYKLYKKIFKAKGMSKKCKFTAL